MEKSKRYAFAGIWYVSEAEMIAMLDTFSLNEIQVMIEQRVFGQKLYKAIRPYLVERAKKYAQGLVKRANGE